MSTTNPAKTRPSSLLHSEDEPGVYRVRVFYLCINGRRSVVGAWQLYETMRRLKLLNMYSQLEELHESACLDLRATVHGSSVAVSVGAGTWQVRLGARLPAAFS